MNSWIVTVSIVLALACGFAFGAAAGIQHERTTIANECRYSNHFTNKRSGFYCLKIVKQKAEVSP